MAVELRKVDETCKLKRSCRAALLNFVRMSNLCESFEALIDDFESGSVGNLENGIKVVVGLYRSHLLEFLPEQAHGGVS